MHKATFAIKMSRGGSFDSSTLVSTIQSIIHRMITLEKIVQLLTSRVTQVKQRKLGG